MMELEFLDMYSSLVPLCWKDANEMNLQITAVLPSFFWLCLWGNPIWVINSQNLKNYDTEEEASLFAVVPECGQMLKTEDMFYLRLGFTFSWFVIHEK